MSAVAVTLPVHTVQGEDTAEEGDLALRLAVRESNSVTYYLGDITQLGLSFLRKGNNDDDERNMKWKAVCEIP